MSEKAIYPDLALIGAGYWGKNLARNFHTLGVLHTLCDNSEATLVQYASEYNAVRRCTRFEEVLADTAIKKVAIAAPATMHYKLGKAALLAGKDVFVEKPLCLDTGGGQELVELAEKKGLILMVGHLLQYHACVQKLQWLLSDGQLGKLQYVISNRLNLGKIRLEENALWSFAPHDISVILSLADNKLPEHVSCTGGAYLTPGVADTTLTVLKFSGGVRSHVFVTWLNPFKEQKLTVVGSNGMAVFDDTRAWNEKLILHRNYLTWTRGQMPVPSKSKGEPVEVPQSEPLKDECLHFLQCCADRHSPKTDGREGLRVLQVLQSAQQSLDCDGELVSTAPSSRPALYKSTVTPPTTVKSQEQDPVDFFVHPTAIVDEGANIGKGTKIWHFCHIMKGTKIGERCIFGQNVNVDGGTLIGNNVKVQNNVSIYSGLVIEDDVFLGPSCVLTNVSNPRSQINRHSIYEKTTIKRGATIGANATVVCGATIGRYAFIAAGSVVTKDVLDYALMMGNPARQKGWMSRHGHIMSSQHKDGIMVCPESGMRYQLDSSGTVHCLDLPEDEALPERLRTGGKSYDQFKTVQPS